MASGKSSKKPVRGNAIKAAYAAKSAVPAKNKAVIAVSKTKVQKPATPAVAVAKSANSRASAVNTPRSAALAGKSPAKSKPAVSKPVAGKAASKSISNEPAIKTKQSKPVAKADAGRQPKVGTPAKAFSKPASKPPAVAVEVAKPVITHVNRVVAPKPGANRSAAEKIAAVRAAAAKVEAEAAKPKPVSTAPTAMLAAIPGPRPLGPNGQRSMGGFASTRPGLPPHLAINVKAMPKPGGGKHHGFKANEFIVYPSHGVGQITAIEEQEVAGFKLELFVINFAKDKMTLKVPAPKVANGAIRKLAEPALVQKALDTLTGRARIKRTMWSRRAQEYEAKINSGDLIAIAEVVRDLYRSDAQPEQSYSERQLYEAALDRMGREIASVQKLTEMEAAKVIDTQLQKGPRRGVRAEAEVEADAEADSTVEEAA